MCLILHRPIGRTFDRDLFVPARENNPHGFGIMFPIGNGKVKAIKGLFDLDTINKIWDKVDGFEVAAHFRFTTAGARTVENCHPFQVLSLEEHGRDLWMMHNGTIGQVPRPNQEMSDTWHFVENYLRQPLTVKPDLIDNPEFQKFLGDIVGHSKLLFMDGNGLVAIVNQQMGNDRDGCWISNTYSIRDKRPKTVATGTAGGTQVAGTLLDDDYADNRKMSKRERRRAAAEQERIVHGGKTRSQRQRELDAAFSTLEEDEGEYEYPNYRKSGRGSHAMSDDEWTAQQLAEYGIQV